MYQVQEKNHGMHSFLDLLIKDITDKITNLHLIGTEYILENEELKLRWKNKKLELMFKDAQQVYKNLIEQKEVKNEISQIAKV